MEIHGPHGVNPVFPRRSVEYSEPAGPSGLEMPRDEIQISPEARALAEIAESGELRHERIEEIRHMIAAGVYEQPEKLTIAVDRLLEELRSSGAIAE